MRPQRTNQMFLVEGEVGNMTTPWALESTTVVMPSFDVFKPSL